MHVARIRARVASAHPIETVVLPTYRLYFHKSSTDGSAKCNACFTGHHTDRVLGVVYAMESVHKLNLDLAEGLGHGYFQSDLVVWGARRSYSVFAYLSHPAYVMDGLAPYAWYRELVLQGARHHSFPTSYVEAISQVACKEDANIERNQKMLKLARVFHEGGPGTQKHASSRT